MIDRQGKLPYAADFYDTFYFEKNLQGDIIAVYNENGLKIVSYNYDAWGNHTYTWHNTSSANIPAAYNPFRYRGYYYDIDTSLYYLQSRYYNPAWGRFLNADGYLNANGDILGYNFFSYCSNNPITYMDSIGTRKEKACAWFDGGGSLGHPEGGVVKGYTKTHNGLTTTVHDTIYIAPKDVEAYYINEFNKTGSGIKNIIFLGGDIAFTVIVKALKDGGLKTIFQGLADFLGPVAIACSVVEAVDQCKTDQDAKIIKQAIAEGKGIIISHSPTVTGDPRIVNIDTIYVRIWDTYPYYDSSQNERSN